MDDSAPGHSQPAAMRHAEARENRLLTSPKGRLCSSAPHELANMSEVQAQAPERFRAVTSISIRMRGSESPAEIIVAAGRTSPKCLRRMGQHSGNSLASGRM